MPTGIQSLTDKEKQTLRLLLTGYDAKSMARHLGLSVHTINERLRDARRKLEVSSSREAARQLREAEDETPQRLGDEQIGEALPAAGVAQAASSAAKAGQSPRPGLILGGIVMSLSLALVALTSINNGAELAAPTKHEAEQSSAAAESAAIDAAKRWLALVDARDWSGSYNGTSRSFKAANTLLGWTKAVEQVHGKLGPASSRELISAEDVPAPPYGYWSVKFKTSYANKAEGTETLALVSEDGAWKVAGIYAN